MAPARRGAALAVGLVILSSFQTAGAADGDLQRALLDSGCINPAIKTMLSTDRLVVYQANCLGSSHKVIEVVCMGVRCSVSDPSTERDE